jgi:hypothetical protein
VRWFRRGESLNDRLLREAGLERAGGEGSGETRPGPLDPLRDFRQTFDRAGGLIGAAGLPARAREWDVFVTVEAPDVQGDQVEFVTLPDGSLLVETEEGDASLDPLAAAVEQRLQPPYRARAARQTDSLWAVSARRIEVARFEADGDRIELTQTLDGKSLRVDEMPSFGSIPALEALGQAVGPAYAAHAERLDADLWEVKVAAL